MILQNKYKIQMIKEKEKIEKKKKIKNKKIKMKKILQMML